MPSSSTPQQPRHVFDPWDTSTKNVTIIVWNLHSHIHTQFIRRPRYIAEKQVFSHVLVVPLTLLRFRRSHVPLESPAHSYHTTVAVVVYMMPKTTGYLLIRKLLTWAEGGMYGLFEAYLFSATRNTGGNFATIIFKNCARVESILCTSQICYRQLFSIFEGVFNSRYRNKCPLNKLYVYYRHIYIYIYWIPPIT